MHGRRQAGDHDRPVRRRRDEATAAVVSGKDDAGLADSPVMAYAVEQTNGQLELLGDVYDAAPYGYVVAKDQTEFAQAIADAVEGADRRRQLPEGARRSGASRPAPSTDPTVNPTVG